MQRTVEMSRLNRILRAGTLDDLYSLIPQSMGCDGSCHQSCGPIVFTPEEGERIKAAGGCIPNLRLGEEPAGIDCPALTADNRCSIYEARPTLCRLWGSTSGLPCMAPGCRTKYPLTDEESRAVLYQAEALSALSGLDNGESGAASVPQSPRPRVNNSFVLGG